MMPSTAVEPVLQEAIAALALRLANVIDQRDAACRMLVSAFADDRDTLLANGSFTFLEADGSKVTLDELVEQREHARAIAAHLEAECAANDVENVALKATIARVRALSAHWHAVGKADGVSARHANELDAALAGVDA